MQLGLGFWASKTLLTGIELGLFTQLASGPLDEAQLRSRLGLHPRGARDFLDALVALGMLNREDGRYSNTVDTDLFLDKNKQSYVGGMLEMANGRLWTVWGKLGDALRTGKPQIDLKDGDKDIFAMMSRQPEEYQQFIRAMTGLSMGSARAIAQKFPWDRYKTFVDIGTAQGGLVVEVTSAHANMRGIGLDLAPVKPVFEEFIQAAGVADRASFQTFDIFQDKVPSVDVVVMGHMLHGWNLADKKMFIAKAYDALPEGGSLVVYDAMIDNERRTNAFGLLMSLTILLETREGFDYTSADCVGWMHDQGFKYVQSEPLLGPDSMVVGTK